MEKFELVKVPKKSNGQKFKEKYGYSKTIKRLLRKHGVSIEEYRRLVKERKKRALALKRDKHAVKSTNRRLSGKKTKIPVVKTKKKKK